MCGRTCRLDKFSSETIGTLKVFSFSFVVSIFDLPKIEAIYVRMPPRGRCEVRTSSMYTRVYYKIDIGVGRVQKSIFRWFLNFKYKGGGGGGELGPILFFEFLVHFRGLKTWRATPKIRLRTSKLCRLYCWVFCWIANQGSWSCIAGYRGWLAGVLL